MRPILVFLLGCCLGGVLGFVIDKSTDRYVEYGTVVSTIDEKESGGNGSWYEVKTVTIEKIDGSKSTFNNDDDLLIWKRNSRELQDKIVDGKMYRFVVNGFRNILSVSSITNSPSYRK